jgi:orotate phosphoribosyltransferase
MITTVNKTLQRMFTCGAYWNYENSNKIYHAELTSGLHSNEFFNFGKLNRASHIEDIILESPVSGSLLLNIFDCVCGQAYGSIAMSVVLSLELIIPFIFTEKDSNGEMCLSRYKDQIENYNNILMAEDVCTTLKTTKKSIECIGVDKVSGIVTIINRTGCDFIIIDGKKLPIYSCADVNTVQHSKVDCPMCQEGSIAIRPKKDKNWELLMGF